MHVSLITTIAWAFAAAWVLGIITQRLRLSPIVGYLLAGIALGPHTPGFKGDTQIAGQLAEIGVALLMFGVGLRFHLSELLAVKNIAVPGAIGQSLVATCIGTLVAVAFGWPVRAGLVLGVAIAVASTVVLLRVLMDNYLLDTPHGHVAVGWLVVEDLFTVLVLVLIPALAVGGAGAAGVAGGTHGMWVTLTIAFAKLAIFVALLLVAGSRIIPWLMVRVAQLRSRELFTLTVLVMAVTVAAASQHLFGASMALGAFLAGIVVGQSPVSHQAAADVLPLRDAFAVLFFVSVGMLFNPAFVVHHPMLVLACLGVVMICKPLTALLIVAIIGYPARTGIIVALALAQIGEFSFILAELGRQYGLVTNAGNDVVVACALVSITLSPLLLRSADPMERFFRSRPRLWRWLNHKTLRRQAQLNAAASTALESSDSPVAVVLGYGPVGQAVDGLIRKLGLETVVIDLNMDTVQRLTRQGRLALFGDAYNVELMAEAMARATHVLITLPHSANRVSVIATAKLINPEVKVLVRAHYIAEHEELLQAGADAVCYEEAESAIALSRLILEDQHAAPEIIRKETTRLRQEFAPRRIKPASAS